MQNTVIIASKNPVKIEATKAGFQRMLKKKDLIFEGVSVPSNVSDQPMTHEETRKGASNRSENAKSKFPNADFWVGIEGGVHQDEFGMQAFAWIVVQSNIKKSQAQTAVFYIPEPIAKMVTEGIELGEADDIYFGRSNSKQKDGAVGILTHGEIDRKAYYEHAMVMALIPFLKYS
ncbi:inosine/xanthosine triphosphatase [Marivirga sericea]|uniref:Probable inosine/xanthosine triphosphatase n=1 Tax=Marivirga sericea TaxID=1028 RepID=A0A1X7KG00_9BACT|nr:inosine/xanthosine triphosphatase [Marivirga sericea]SMG39936.1 inosine/xanthosine triphosphatase [Marivirga sericea]